MFSCGLAIVEIAVGECKTSPQELLIESHHVVRSYDLLMLCHEIRAIIQGDKAVQERQARDEQATAVEIEGRRKTVDSAPPNFPRSQWPEFQLTQANPAVGEALGEADATAFSAVEAPSGQRVDAPLKLLSASDPEVPEGTTGYGVNCSSVQNPDCGPVFISDREVMKKSLSRGKKVVFVADVCDALRTKVSEEGYTRRKTVSLNQLHWETVMKAGLALERIGAFDDGKSAAFRNDRPTIIVSLPPQGDEELEGHFH